MRATWRAGGSRRSRPPTTTSTRWRSPGPEEHWGEREATILSKLGESLYWLGEYERAEHVLERALGVGGDQSDYVCSHASRFLADITLTIRGDADAAAAMFERALEAARKLDDSSVLARTLLMAGWVPFSRDDLDGARRMFEEALAAARLSDRTPDRWSEVRALVSLSSVTSEAGDELDALALAEEGLEIGRASGQEFATATAEEKVALALRHMLRLDESLEHSERAIRTYRELGARWELAGRDRRSRRGVPLGRPAGGRRGGAPRGVLALPRAEGARAGDVDRGRAHEDPDPPWRSERRRRRRWRIRRPGWRSWSPTRRRRSW